MRQFQPWEPSPAELERAIAQMQGEAFTYPGPGLTAGADASLESRIPHGYVIDRTHAQIGSGAADWERARAALADWAMFDLGWTALWPRVPPAVGTQVGVLACTLGAWSFNVSRILYVVDESTEARERYGFAYGTVPHHVERGEELFTVEWRHADDSVWYVVTAVSRPLHWLARLAHGYARRTQRRFAAEAVRHMRKVVQGGELPPGNGVQQAKQGV